MLYIGFNYHFSELDGNQLICDCGMSWLIKKSPKKKGVSEDTKCAYPKSLAGKRLKELGGSKWNCRKWPDLLFVAYFNV